MPKKFMIRYTLLLTLSAIIVFVSCKKDKSVAPDAVTVGTADITIANSVNDSVIITMNGLDIATGTIPHIVEVKVAAGDSVTIPYTELKNSFRYYVDWHTKDHKVANWYQFSNDQPLQQKVDYFADSSNYFISINGTPRNDLLICMDGDGIFSNWTAIDAYNSFGNSIWSSLSPVEKNHGFIISRYYTIKHVYSDSAGRSTSNQVSFALQDSTSRFWLNTKVADSFILTNNLYNIAPLQSNAFDTLYYARYMKDSIGNISYPQPYYKIVRTSVQK